MDNPRKKYLAIYLCYIYTLYIFRYISPELFMDTFHLFAQLTFFFFGFSFGYFFFEKLIQMCKSSAFCNVTDRSFTAHRKAKHV